MALGSCMTGWPVGPGEDVIPVVIPEGFVAREGLVDKADTAKSHRKASAG